MFKEQEIKQAFYSQRVHNFIEWLKYRHTLKMETPDGTLFQERYSRRG
jgi:hypothetical protein